MKRSRWGVLLVESILEALTRTEKPLRTIMDARGYSYSDYVEFIQWLYRDPERTARYLVARRVKVRRMGSRLLDLSDDDLVSLGKRGISRELHRCESLRPMVQRRAEARQRRAARAAVDPLYAARQRAKSRKPI